VSGRRAGPAHGEAVGAVGWARGGALGDADGPQGGAVGAVGWARGGALGDADGPQGGAVGAVGCARGGALGDADGPQGGAVSDADRELIDAWSAEADLLLAERARSRDHEQVALPRQLPVSSLVTIARDPAELARQVRRPMPAPPARSAVLGTEFHRWLEQRFGAPRLIDAGDLPAAEDLIGSADARRATEGSRSAVSGGDALADLKARFEAGEWGSRWPVEVEVPFQAVLGDRVIRGRIDAVFADAPDGSFDVVDWKTGRPPGTPAERQAVAVQLAAYRVAWAALAGVPVSRVRAAFYYVAEDLTVHPADLLDEAGLTALVEGVPVQDLRGPAGS
jgi:DNA helicase-2/ATP-dependent DNA helicase PcrA